MLAGFHPRIIALKQILKKPNILFINPFIQSIILILFLGLVSCNAPRFRTNTPDGKVSPILQPRFAKGFRIVQENDSLILQIFDPWNDQKLLGRTVLSAVETVRSETYPDKSVLELPVKQFVALSSTQWGMLLQLGSAATISGISEASYVQDSIMRHLLEKGAVVEVARDGLFRYELLSRMPNAVVLYSPDAAGLPTPLTEMPLKLLPWPDFAEPHPLGRTEWLRLIGYLVGKQRLADSIFETIATDYLALTNLAKNAYTRPTVFSDKLFAGQWYIPGGKSYIARLFDDAGANYVFGHLDAKGSVPLDPEVIVARAADAAYWRIPHAGDIGGYDGLLAENPVYGKFAAFRNKRVIYCNTLESGYFERGPLEPNILLADLIAIFHPELLPGHKPRYHALLQ